MPGTPWWTQQSRSPSPGTWSEQTSDTRWEVLEQVPSREFVLDRGRAQGRGGKEDSKGCLDLERRCTKQWVRPEKG